MMKTINRYSLIALMIALMAIVTGCTKNDGDPFGLYGVWHLTAAEDGTGAAIAIDPRTYIAFQNDIVKFYSNDGLVGTSESYGKLAQEGDHYLLEADMPGFKKEDIHVDLDENLLTIFVDHDEAKEEKNENGFVIHERRTGRMSRAFNVEGIDKEGIQAAYQDGVLKLTLPKEQPQPKETKRTIAIC